MNPLRELKTLVNRDSDSIELGVVVSVGKSSIAVRAKNGLKSFSVPLTSLFKPGDYVRYQGNILLGKSISVDSLPVFIV